jgi:hypothetical protein
MFLSALGVGSREPGVHDGFVKEVSWLIKSKTGEIEFVRVLMTV